MSKRRGMWLVELVALVVTLAACSTTRSMFKSGQTWTLTADPKVPAAQGTVRVAPGSDGNQTVDVEVQHMAPPGKVFDGTSFYVVWLIPPGEGARQNLGVLPIGGDLKGRLTTKTPFRDFDIVITAENAPNDVRPSGNQVMSTSVHLT